MINGISERCSHCKKPTDCVHVAGSKCYCPKCMQSFQKGTKGSISQIFVIRDIYMPSHAGEKTYGYALMKQDSKWFFVIDTFYAKPGSATQESCDFYELPDGFFAGMTHKKLADALCKTIAEGKNRGVDYNDMKYAINHQMNDVNYISELFT